jgi:hypothetical protein
VTKFRSKEFKSLICGDKLGEGMSREVFVYRPDHRFVIKFENGARMFQNLVEWEAWSFLKGTKRARWFAPCHDISSAGSILIQERARPLIAKENLLKVPKFLTDIKRDNFGVIDGKIVCFDYGTIIANLRTL